MKQAASMALIILNIKFKKPNSLSNSH